MNTEEIIRNIEPRYTVVKNKDLSKDATVYYHEDDVKKAIAKALTLGNVSQQSELLQKIESVKNFEWGISPVDNENRMCELIKLL